MSVPFIVPGLIQRRSINLIIGSSGSGKTNFILPQLNAYAAGDNFLGYRLGQPPEQLGAITCHRTLDNIYYRVNELELDHLMAIKAFPITYWKPKPESTDIEALEDAYADLCAHANRPVKFILVEGIQLLMTSGKINDQNAVRRFFDGLNEFCIKHDVTIIGTVGTAKMKRGEYYPQLADQVFGSILWAHESSTLIGIELTDLHLPVERRTGLRRIILQPQNGLPSVRYADFDAKSRLMLVDRPEAVEAEKESPSHVMLDAKLDTIYPGTKISRDTFLQWGEEIAVSTRTVDRWIAIRSDDEIGMLEKIGSGKNTIYVKPIKH